MAECKHYWVTNAQKVKSGNPAQYVVVGKKCSHCGKEKEK